MAHLKALTKGTSVKGVSPDCLVMVVGVRWHGSAVLGLTYKAPSGNFGNQLLFRDNEPRLEIIDKLRLWSFDGDGKIEFDPTDRETEKLGMTLKERSLEQASWGSSK